MPQDLQDRVVVPTLAAGAMFDAFPYLTRLYTTLSPGDMNKDPVFSYNRPHETRSGSTSAVTDISTLFQTRIILQFSSAARSLTSARRIVRA
jgi:hypothetical protein